MIYGYARISKKSQNLNLQIDKIEKYGVDKICKEKKSGASTKKPVLDLLLENLKSGDKLVIWKLDRLGRRTIELMQLQQTFEKNGIILVSLTEQIDTSTPLGKFFFHMLCCWAEMERNVLIERTNAGLAAAKARGKFGGRPKGISHKQRHKIEKITLLYKEYLEGQKYTIDQMCQIASVSKATFYKYLRHGGTDI